MMTHRLVAVATLVALSTIPRGTAAQELPRNTNWVDTVAVGRLPTGGCEWSKVSERMRPGKPGTTTRAGTPSERTCTVIVYNTTTGSGQERPIVVGFGYAQDQQSPATGNHSALVAERDTRIAADTAVFVPPQFPDTGPVPSPNAAGDAAAVVLKTFARPDTLQITKTLVKGDSAWVWLHFTPTTWTTYTLVNRGGVWRIVGQEPGRRSP